MTDWGEREWDQKPDTRPGDNTDRAKPYMRMHKKMHRSLYCQDVDQLEYAFDENGEPYPVALIELTCVGIGKTFDADYRSKVEQRASTRDAQVRVLRTVARMVYAKLYYVAYELTEPDDPEVIQRERYEVGYWLNRSIGTIWVADFLDTDPPFEWKRYDRESYEAFLLNLRRERTDEMSKPTQTTESTGSTRVDDDREKLREAVGFFRINANLHASSSDDALITYAHGNGRKKLRADMVRTAWHDYEMACQYAELPVTRYIVARQQRLFADGEKVSDESAPPPSDADAPKDREQLEREFMKASGLEVRDGGSVSSSDLGGSSTTGTAEPSSVSDEVGPCYHKVRLNDGEHVVCDDCGEVLGPAPETERDEPEPEPQPKRKATKRKKAATATDPPDDEEVLF